MDGYPRRGGGGRWRGRGGGGERGGGGGRRRGNFGRGGGRPQRERGGPAGYRNDNDALFMNTEGSPRHGDGNERRIRPIGYKRLEEMEKDETPENIIIVLGHSGSGLEQLLRGDRGRIDHGMTQMLLKVFGKMLEYDDFSQSLSRILRLIIQYDFHQTILDFIYSLLTEKARGRIEKAPMHIRNTIKLMNKLLSVLPNQSLKKVSMMTIMVQAVIDGLGGLPGHPDVQELHDEVKAMLASIQETQNDKRQKQKARVTGLSGMKELHEKDAPTNFREISVFPQLEDLQVDFRPFIRSNLIDGAYRNIEHYLDVQFRLLREDFIKPLRDGINEIKKFGDQEDRKKVRFQNVKVYEGVKVLFAKPDQKGILHKIQFSTERFKYIRWQNTKRLLYGNLLCFSSDQFQNEVLFAVVADRKPEDLEQGHLTVAFVYENDDEDEEEDELDDDSDDDDPLAGYARPPRRRQQQRRIGLAVDVAKVYTMVETDAYFEAYRHVLAGLRDTRNIPLERYIVQCREDMHAPEYLRPTTAGTVFYDFSSITDHATNVQVLGYDWPSPDELNLNQSQAEALKLALTNELAIIQGPPGTGKTHVGLKIMELLLNNKEIWSRHLVRYREDTSQSSPILVVCYTNHALDQFLEGIAKFSKKDQVIVRVGGRCKNEVTKEFSLNEIRQKRRKNPVRNDDNKATRKAIWNIKNDLKRLEAEFQAGVNQLEASLHCIQKLDQLRDWIPTNLYHQFNIISTPFDFNDDPWTPVSTESPDDTLLTWLGLRGGKAEVDYMHEYAKVSDLTKQYLRMFGHSDENVGRAFHETGNDEFSVLHEHICQNEEKWQGRQDETGEAAPVANEDEGVMEEADLLQEQRMLDTGCGIYNLYENVGLDDARNIGKQNNNDREIDRIMKRMAAVTFEEIGEGDMLKEQEGGWQQTKTDKKKAKRKIRQQLGKTTTMSDAEEMMIHDIHSLTQEDRWRLYRTWVSRWRDQFRHGSEARMVEYNQFAKQLEELRRKEDAEILQGADVVAVTTTGAAKYRDLIYKLNSKIVVVEEAAEVLEAHIITSMPRTTQHLILIGDHQQLRPSPTVYELARHYNLDTSLFERLMKVRIPHKTLNIQHRMRPEIADLIRPRIYKELHDHESVLYRAGITGIEKSMFFITHNVAEESLEDGKSKKNLHEAAFLVKLCEYLLMQGYKPEEITILTMYTGQIFAFRDDMKKTLTRGVRVTAVDNFQGEENNIILLSLVRSNDQASIGFLGIENRICVALSRAKLALYCIGDIDLLSAKSQMWRKIQGHLYQGDSIGEELMLQCKNHPEKLTPVKNATDFKNVPEGGCGQQCQFRLDCGHACPRVCHPDDHSKTKCIKTCNKELECGHKCKKKCWQSCEPCTQKTTKIVPKCGHEQKVPCSQSIETMICTQKIEVKLSCGHKRTINCVDNGKVDRTWCKEKCSNILDCVHTCKGSCSECYQGRLHLPCGNKCGRTLVCGHICKSVCSCCPPCEEKCKTRCKHSKCGKKCGEPCRPCKEPCTWKCSHYKCTKLCSEPCNRPPCNKPCDKTIKKCGHPCIGLCGEPCPKLCRICDEQQVTEVFFGVEDEPTARFVQLEDCLHIFEYTGLDRWMNLKEEGNAIKMKECPRCKVAIWRSTRYGNVVNKLLESVNEVKQTIWGDVIQAESSTVDLILEMEEENQQMKTQFYAESATILRKLKDRPSPGKIVVLEKALRRLQKLTEFKKARQELSLERLVCLISLRAFDRDLEMITKWVMLDRPQTTEQDEKGFSDETRRLKHILKYVDVDAKCKTILATSSLKYDNVTLLLSQIKTLLLKTYSSYTTLRRKQVRGLFKKINEEAPELRSSLGITDDERKMICSAMGFASKGHWYKCPNGHVYAIGDCGGAVVKSTCPMCRAEIGGTGHQLLSSNQVATEMDGATRPAYDIHDNRIPQQVLDDLRRQGYG